MIKNLCNWLFGKEKQADRYDMLSMILTETKTPEKFHLTGTYSEDYNTLVNVEEEEVTFLSSYQKNNFVFEVFEGDISGNLYISDRDFITIKRNEEVLRGI